MTDDIIASVAAAAADRFFRSKGVPRGESLSMTREQLGGALAGALDISKHAIDAYAKVRSFESEIAIVADMISAVVIAKLNQGPGVVLMTPAQVKWLVQFALHGHTSYLLGLTPDEAALTTPPMPTESDQPLREH